MAVAIVHGLVGCGGNDPGGGRSGPGGPPDVTTVTVHVQDVPVVEELPGRTRAFRIAEVRPRVSGIIVERLFEEGSDVEAGDQLYQLDDAQYKVAMQRAEASHTQALAAQHAAQLKVDRYKPLVGTRSISRQDYDDALIALEQATASVQVAQAAVATARLDLEYTHVYAPIAGRIGKSLVTEGTLVTANQSEALAVIAQLDPIYVDIERPSTENPRTILRKQAPVDVTLVPSPAIAGYDGTGKLKFSDVLVDESTGAVQLRALFPNPGHRLLPGLFVNARLDLGTERGILLTQKAVTRDEAGNAQVWRLDDEVVHHVRVETRRAVADKWLITDGLADGDVVVTEGTQRLSPETAVVPHPAGAAAGQAAQE